MSTTITPQPCVFTLGAQGILTDISDILVYVLRHFCSVPKSASNTFYDISFSLSDILSIYSGVSNAVIQPITAALNTMLNNIFGQGANVSVTVSTTPVTDTTYTITILVQVVKNGFIYSVDPTATVSNGSFVMANDFVPITAQISA